VSALHHCGVFEETPSTLALLKTADLNHQIRHQKIWVRASQRSGEGGLVVSIEIVLIPMMMFGLFLAALIIVFGQCAGNPA
jgi:hypothetical protein